MNKDGWIGLLKHINALLAVDSDISYHHPLPACTSVIFDDRKDGLVPAELGKDSVPDTINERVLDGKSEINIWLNAFHMTINRIISISSLDAVGCSVVNIGGGTRETFPWRQNAVISLWNPEKLCLSCRWRRYRVCLSFHLEREMIGLVAICIVQSPGLVYDGGRSVVEVTALEKWNL